MQVSENLMIIVNMITVFSFTALVIKVILEWRKFRYKIELHQKFMDKFSNTQDLGAFLETENGKQLLDGFTTEKSSPTRDKMLSTITKAVVLAFLGLGFFLISHLYPFDDSRVFGVFGIIALALGLGFGVSTIISFTLSRKWGIINGDTE
jgi:hypothetical protein